MKPQAIDLTATLWRNASDSEPQLTVMLPDGSKAWLRVPKSSAKAYAKCVAVLDAVAEGWNPAKALDDFEMRVVAHIELEETP